MNIPPFPTLVKMGVTLFGKGKKHVKRTFVVFDLIYVKKGVLYMSEADKRYQIDAGKYIILAPSLEHFGYKGCDTESTYYWLHFIVEGDYSINERVDLNWGDIRVKEGDFVVPNKYSFQIPRFGEIKHTTFVEKIFENMITMNDSLAPDFPLRQQIYFEELLLQLQQEAMRIPSATERITEKALQYIQQYYKTDIKMEDLAKELHFHTDYITRCMQKTIGKSPIQYLNQYRISQAKRLLTTTNDKVMTISKNVGISDHTYFSKLFKKMEGVNPSEYRQLSQRES
jgi:AraC-like DNA-binding protein